MNRIRNKGFTLTEVLIVIGMVSILAAIAIPAYANYVRRAARADAQMALMDVAQYMERVYSECNNYTLRDASTTPPCTTTVTGLPSIMTKSPREGTPRYTISLSAQAAQTYTIIATPLYADDCGTFRLTNTGTRDLLPGTFAASFTVSDCWRR